MQWLAEICVKRPVFATVLTLLIVVLGLAGYARLGVDRFPKIEFPVVIITTVLPGASPVDMETEVSDKIEAAVNTIGDIEELRSISSESVSLVVVQFKLDKNLISAAQDVRDRVNLVVPELPSDIKAPVISTLDPDAAPILFLALRAPGRSVREITELADNQIREALEVLPGVGQARILGGQKRTINVWLDPERLRSLGVGPQEIARALGTQNVSLPGGRLDSGREQVNLRVHGRAESAAELAALPVRGGGDQVIRVGDLARVEDGQEEQGTAAIWNGESAVMLAIRKQSGANTLEVADAVRERVEELRAELPLGTTIDIVRDESASVRTSTDAVKEHLLLGGIFAAIVVFFFLGSLRSTIIAALAIPTSVIGTFGIMAYLGYSLNTITLLALALCVGIVIDDAIVVLENIYRFIEEKGLSPMEAAIEGTRDIGLAVLATTLSLIAVFMPVAFLAGIPGRFLASFGVTMSVSIAVSLIVSFTLTPMLASRWLRKHSGTRSGLERVVDIFYRPIERAYMWLLGHAMNHRWVVVVLCVASMGLVPIMGSIVKKGFLPENDDGHFEVTVRAPEGASIATTAVYAERIARELRAYPEVALTVTTIGDNDQQQDNVAKVYTRLTDPTLRARSMTDMMDVTRKEVLSHQDPSLRVNVGQVAAFGGGGASTARVQYNLVGPDLDGLQKYADQIAAGLRKVPGAVDVDTSLVSGKPELGVFVDRAAASDLGVSPLDVASTLSLLVGGQKVSTFEVGAEQYEVRMRAASKWRASADTLGFFAVPSSRLGSVPLSSVARFETASGPSAINRLARQRVVNITANAAPGYGDSAIGDAMVKVAKDLNMPAGYALKPTGQTKLLAETAQSVLFGFGLAFIFMYLVLAAQFESWVHPFTILLSLPLTLPWALTSLVLTDQALGMFSVLGIFVLFGIVKKNAILQIDHTNKLRAEGLNRMDAIMHANRDRLRPILMTTVAFVAGMIPLAFSVGVGAGFNRATSGVVVGGQTLSLLLTLLATPVAYSIIDDISALFWRAAAWLGLAKEA